MAGRVRERQRRSPIAGGHSRQRARQRARLPALHFAYGEIPLTVESNGHTMDVIYDDSALDHVRVGQRTCQLQQFHSHHTAEHPLGGTVYPMEAHPVHNCGPNDLLVVGVLLHYLDEEPNPALATALEHAPRDGEQFVTSSVSISKTARNAGA